MENTKTVLKIETQAEIKKEAVSTWRDLPGSILINEDVK